MKNGLIIDSVGNKYWYKEGKLHTEDGPAVEYYDDSKVWYKEGQLHREDGPAIEYFNGIKFWYYEGKQLNVSSQEEFIRLVNLKLFW